jgi:hypothetical protein
MMKRGVLFAGLALSCLATAGGVAHAGVISADVGLNPIFDQVGPTTVNPEGGFFSGRAFVSSSGDYDGGTLSYGGPGSPQSLSFSSADVAWAYGSPKVFPFSDLQDQFPTGPYTFNLTGADGPTPVSITYDGDAFSNIPQLTAESYGALQGLNAADSITVDFNAMEPSGNATDSFVFFSVFDSSNNVVAGDGFLPSDTTSVSIAGGTLKPGQAYTFEVLFSDRITGFDDVAGVPTTQFYDTRTDAAFSTAAGAVPEPSTWAMLLIGFAGLGFAGYRSSRKLNVPATAG